MRRNKMLKKMLDFTRGEGFGIVKKAGGNRGVRKEERKKGRKEKERRAWD